MFGTGNLWDFKCSSTEKLFPSLIFSSWFHNLGGIIPFDAKINATVWHLLFFIKGSCLNLSSGMIPFKAYNIAYVLPFSS